MLVLRVVDGGLDGVSSKLYLAENARYGKDFS
jgi:hypothetical protein